MKIEPIETYILTGLQSRFRNAFKCPVVLGSTEDKLQLIPRLFEGRQVTYPYMFLTLGNIARNDNSYNSRYLGMTGLRSMHTASNTLYRVRLIPATFSFDVVYVTNTVAGAAGAMEFAKKWIFASRFGHVDFQIAYGDLLNIRITSQLDQTVSIPESGNKAESVSEYEASASLELQGYVSESEYKAVGVVSELQLEERLRAELGDNVTTWKFPTRS